MIIMVSPEYNSMKYSIANPASIGIDIGKVIIDATTDRVDRVHSSRIRVSESEYLEGAIEAIRDFLHDQRIKKVCLVSKCGPILQSATEEFLDETGFFDKTNVARSEVYFCRQRQDKGVIAENLGLTHFIDDRVGVLNYMPSNVTSRLLFMKDYSNHDPIPGNINKLVRGWHTAWWAIQETLD